jgi:hypothetical protein
MTSIPASAKVRHSAASCCGVDAERWAAEGPGQRVGHVDVDQFDIRLQRAVAEQHVHQLAGVIADRLAGQLQVGEAGSVGLRLDAFDAGQHLVEHAGLADRLGRHLDALLDGEQPGPVHSLPRSDVQAVDDVDPGRRHGMYFT